MNHNKLDLIKLIASSEIYLELLGLLYDENLNFSCFEQSIDDFLLMHEWHVKDNKSVGDVVIRLEEIIENVKKCDFDKIIVNGIYGKNDISIVIWTDVAYSKIFGII